MVPFFFDALTQGQGLIVFLVAFVAFALVIIYSMGQTGLPSGVAFGFGLTTSSFVGSNIWLGVLAVAAMLMSLAEYAGSASDAFGLTDELSLAQPAD